MITYKDLGNLDNITFIGISHPNPKNALIAIPHEGSHQLYHLKFKTDKIKKVKDGLQSPKLEILSHEESSGLTEQIDKELKRKAEQDESLGIMRIVETIPLQGSLDYKLNLAALYYLICKKYLEE